MLFLLMKPMQRESSAWLQVEEVGGVVVAGADTENESPDTGEESPETNKDSPDTDFLQLLTVFSCFTMDVPAVELALIAAATETVVEQQLDNVEADPADTKSVLLECVLP